MLLPAMHVLPGTGELMAGTLTAAETLVSKHPRRNGDAGERLERYGGVTGLLAPCVLLHTSAGLGGFVYCA